MRFPLWAMTALLLAARALTAAPPANDNLINAIALTGTNITVAGSNVDATKEIGEPNHQAPGGKSVWWKWTAPAAGSVIVQSTGSSFDTLLAAYTGSSITSLGDSLVASNDDSGSAKTSLIGFNVTAGVTYRIVVDGFNGASGEIQLALAYRSTPLPPVPANNNFTNRIILSGPVVTATGANYFATKEPREPDHADELGGASVWWSWAAPVDGTVIIDTAGSSFDTLLAVYTGSSLTNLQAVASSDDVSTNQPTSLVTFQATAQTIYQIAVDGFDGQPGDIQLNIQMNAIWLDLPRRLPSGDSQITVTGRAGKQLALEASASLATWERLATLPNPTGIVQFTDTAVAGRVRRFYRVQQVP